ncbi:PREDICTED: UPF0556 protein C19orf10 homolog, partial [Buceros rhinoceros silvestris]|uniref:UPF0556 protein C19orf10 homolog n=1 Tax=Buceros rhinoceros silvestris TaxID=175836 RepID=UPI0005293FFC
GDYSCTFTYSAQGGTNEQWQMNVGVSEDNLLFSCSSQAAVGAQSDIPLKQEEFEITETTVSHREGKFRFELSKLMIVAKTPRDEL